MRVWLAWSTAAALFATLLACATGSATPKPDASETACRVLFKTHKPDWQGDALTRHFQTQQASWQIDILSSVGAQWWVMRIGVPQGLGCEDVIKALQADREIVAAEMDHRRAPSQTMSR